MDTKNLSAAIHIALDGISDEVSVYSASTELSNDAKAYMALSDGAKSFVTKHIRDLSVEGGDRVSAIKSMVRDIVLDDVNREEIYGYLTGLKIIKEIGKGRELPTYIPLCTSLMKDENAKSALEEILGKKSSEMSGVPGDSSSRTAGEIYDIANQCLLSGNDSAEMLSAANTISFIAKTESIDVNKNIHIIDTRIIDTSIAVAAVSNDTPTISNGNNLLQPILRGAGGNSTSLGTKSAAPRKYNNILRKFSMACEEVMNIRDEALTKFVADIDEILKSNSEDKDKIKLIAKNVLLLEEGGLNALEALLPGNRKDGFVHTFPLKEYMRKDRIFISVAEEMLNQKSNDLDDPWKASEHLKAAKDVETIIGHMPSLKPSYMSLLVSANNIITKSQEVSEVEQAADNRQSEVATTVTTQAQVEVEVVGNTVGVTDNVLAKAPKYTKEKMDASIENITKRFDEYKKSYQAADKHKNLEEYAASKIQKFAKYKILEPRRDVDGKIEKGTKLGADLDERINVFSEELKDLTALANGMTDFTDALEKESAKINIAIDNKDKKLSALKGQDLREKKESGMLVRDEKLFQLNLLNKQNNIKGDFLENLLVTKAKVDEIRKDLGGKLSAFSEKEKEEESIKQKVQELENESCKMYEDVYGSVGAQNQDAANSKLDERAGVFQRIHEEIESNIHGNKDNATLESKMRAINGRIDIYKKGAKDLESANKSVSDAITELKIVPTIHIDKSTVKEEVMKEFSDVKTIELVTISTAKTPNITGYASKYPRRAGSHVGGLFRDNPSQGRGM